MEIRNGCERNLHSIWASVAQRKKNAEVLRFFKVFSALFLTYVSSIHIHTCLSHQETLISQMLVEWLLHARCVLGGE